DGADEFGGRRRHDCDDVVSALLQTARDLDGFVGPDASGYPKGDKRHSLFLCVGFDLLDLLGDDLALRNRRLLVLADLDARLRAIEQLTGPGTGGHDKLERVGKFAAVNHMNSL